MKTDKSFYELSDPSPSTAQLGRSSNLAYGPYSGLSYGNPVGIERGDSKNTSQEASYYLKSPPYLTNQKNVSKLVLNRTKVTFVNISWWIYLITCYSLLLDTCILQSRGVTHIRCFFRKYASKKSGSYLLLFILLPMCLATGGYGYLALHGTNSTFFLTYPSYPTFPNHEVVDIPPPKISPPSTEQSEQEKLAESTKLMNLENKLKTMYEEICNLREMLMGYDGKIADFFAEYDSKVQSISTMPIESTVKSLLSEVTDSLQLRLGELTAQNTEDKTQQSDKISSLYELVETATRELKELQIWRLEAGKKLETMSTFQNQKHAMIKELIPLLIPQIEEKVRTLTADATQAVFNDIRNQVASELVEKAKIEILQNQGLDLKEVQKMIDSAVRLYDSDKTGLADYALESSGGIVLSTRCTEPFNGHRPRVSIWGFTLWSEPNNPRVVIQPGIAPGHCWSFKGFDGYLVIQLSRRVIPTSFSLEHIPLSLAPDGNIASAPKTFSVYGLHNDSDIDGVKLGEYFYNSADLPLQTFQVQHGKTEYFSIVELRIHSNHGNPDYTCLYRFRVHGRIG